MRKISVSGRLRKEAEIILCAAVMLAAVIVIPVKADEVEEGNVELKYEPSGAMKEIAPEATEVGKHGKLSIADVDGYTAPMIVDKDNTPYQLRGVSTHGLSWFPQYVNKEAFQTFRDYWGVNLIRIAVYAHEGENAYVNQYAKELTEKAGHDYVEGRNQEYNDKLIQKGVQAATDLGMYVIIDWHVLNYNPNEDLEDATAFFQKYAAMYKDYDNVIFEVCNEPTGTAWLDICDQNNVSYVCWAISNSYESAAYFQENLAKYDGNWTEEDLTTTSKYIINRYNDRKAEEEELWAKEGLQLEEDLQLEEELQSEENLQLEEELRLEEDSHPEEEMIGEEISQADDTVSTSAENTGKSPMIPIVIVVVVIAAGAGVIVKIKKVRNKESK